MNNGPEKIYPYRLLVKHPDSTFFLRAGGDAFGIRRADILVIDRQAEAHDGKLVIASFDGELRVMRIIRRGERAFLEADGQEMEITGREHVFIWGVVTWILKKA